MEKGLCNPSVHVSPSPEASNDYDWQWIAPSGDDRPGPRETADAGS